jgi:hypothetical protein
MNVGNAESLSRIFGRWPSFHDAEVVRVTLDRTGDDGPTLEAVIHVFESTGVVDSTGHYVLANHTEVTFRFLDVAECSLEGFNHQNVLASLEITEIDPSEHEGRQLRIELPSLYGLDATFECKVASIISARAWRPAV